MAKKICFFSAGFAFNRLVRMKYYEKIFPKNVEIFLITTNRFEEKKERGQHNEWDLKRTKIITADYGLTKLPIYLRRFCKENKIDVLINLGAHKAGVFLLPATLFTDTDYIVNALGRIKQHNYKTLKNVPWYILFYLLVAFSKKTIFTDNLDYSQTKKIFPKKDLQFLPAPVETDIFKPKNKKLSRKKLNLPEKEHIVIFVGRVNYAKGSDMLPEIIKKNPSTLFIVIGWIEDKNFLKFKADNLIYIEKKSSEELVDYFSAADLGLFLQRTQGGGLGLTTQECMACGTPAINRNRKGIKKSPALFQIPISPKDATKAIMNFFKKDEKERLELSKIARSYAESNFSSEKLEKRYIKTHLE